MRYEGIFTLPSLEGTIMFPSAIGGINRGGVSHDPKRGLIVVPVSHLAFVATLVPRPDLEQQWPHLPAEVRKQYHAQRGTPYPVRIELLTSPSAVPCNPPPWGTLVIARRTPER